MAEYDHAVVIITDNDTVETTVHQEMVFFRAEIPDRLQNLLIGPISLPGNAFVQYVFLSSGGKRGGALAEEHAEVCKKLLKVFGYRAVLVAFGESYQRVEGRYG